MRPRSIFDLQDTAAGSDTNFLPSPHDFPANPGGESSPREAPAAAILPDVLATASEDGSAHGEGAAATPSFALLDSSVDQGRQTTDPIETSVPDAGSGSINVIGTPDAAPGINLHLALPADSVITTTDALFAPTASPLTPAVSIDLTSLPTLLGGHIADGFEPNFVHSTSQASLDATSTPAVSATFNLASLDNSGGGSPVTNSAVGSGGATAAQVRQALDESGLTVNGSGIKVGVLSDSFNDLGGAAADEADGALPSASNIQVLKDLGSGGTDEGRAMMQIIHDIAPGSSLAFYTADDSEQDFANGILTLAAAGCKVICDDVTYFDEPFFQNGIVAQAIEKVESEGVTFVTSAGNDAANAYQAAWTHGSGTFDNVSFTDAELFNGSVAQTINVTASKADPVPLILEWNLPYGQANFSGNAPDIDMYVFQNGSLIGQFTNVTAGEANNPITGVEFTASGTYQIVIQNNFNIDDPSLIKEILAGDGLPETISGANAGSVFGHHMTPGAITAGAVSAADTPAFGVSPISESFSSSGLGTELLFSDNGTALSSPDLLSPVAVSGLDDIATTISGNLRDFYGTSAASASLAGVAALILSADPNLTPAQVEQFMEQTALPMSNSAISGAGLVQVDPAVADALALVTSLIKTDGSTSLYQVSDYFQVEVGDTGPAIKYGGAAVTVGEFGDWTPIGAIQTASGYDVAWKDAAGGQYEIWALDSNGNYLSSPTGIVPGNNLTLESYETLFNQDINGDGTIGLPSTLIKQDGSTSLYQVGSTFEVEVGGIGPMIKYGGADVTVGEFGDWTPTGAIQTASGYDVAWKDAAGGQYEIWALDSNGNYLSSPTGIVPGNNATLESYETLFNQDFNGDGTIGPPPPTLIKTDGSTSLYQVGNTFEVEVGGIGPAIKYGGAAITVGEFGDWTPIGAIQTASGYDVAWKDAAGGQYEIWALDSNGNFVSSPTGIVPGNNATLESYETLFNQDFNGDGTIGPPPPTLIKQDGSTSLYQAGNTFEVEVGGTGPVIKYSGTTVTVGEFGDWTPIGAIQTASGYDVAWKDAAGGQYEIWALASNGNYLSSPTGIVPGNNATLESYETLFNQDFNGDGTIGPPPPTLIKQDGSTSLYQVGNTFEVEVGGTGPVIKYGGAAVTVGEFGDWTPIGAIQTASGYDVAWKDAAGGQYEIWALESNGNFVSSPTGIVPGNNATLESYETLFNQDINGDGTIGVPATSKVASAALNGPMLTNLHSAATFSLDNFHFNGSALGQSPASAGNQNGPAVTAGHDGFAFAPASGLASGMHSAFLTDVAPPGSAAFAYIHAAPATTSDDVLGNVAVHDAAHLWANHGFHFL